MSGKRDFFRELVGIQILDVGEGHAKASLKIDGNHLNFHGVVHGGAVFTLADCAFAEAVNYGRSGAVAIQVSISFLNPSFDGDVLIAEAVRVSESRRIGLYNVRVTDGKNRLMALFAGTAYLRSSGD